MPCQVNTQYEVRRTAPLPSLVVNTQSVILRQRVQDHGDRLLHFGEDHVGTDIIERLHHKAPVRPSRVRHFQSAAIDNLVAGINDVDINRARRIAILGLMGELDDEIEGHREVARIAETLGIQVVATGTDLYGVRPTDDPVRLIGDVGSGDVVLVKASRSAGLERIAEELLA